MPPISAHSWFVALAFASRKVKQVVGQVYVFFFFKSVYYFLIRGIMEKENYAVASSLLFCCNCVKTGSISVLLAGTLTPRSHICCTVASGIVKT